MQRGAGMCRPRALWRWRCLVSGPRGMRVDGQSLVHVVSRIGIIGAPAVRPDACRSGKMLAGAQDDPDRFVVEDERKTGHGPHLGQLEGHNHDCCKSLQCKILHLLSKTINRHSDTCGLCPSDALISGGCCGQDLP